MEFSNQIFWRTRLGCKHCSSAHLDYCICKLGEFAGYAARTSGECHRRLEITGTIDRFRTRRLCNTNDSHANSFNILRSQLWRSVWSTAIAPMADRAEKRLQRHSRQGKLHHPPRHLPLHQPRRNRSLPIRRLHPSPPHPFPLRHPPPPIHPPPPPQTRRKPLKPQPYKP